MWFNPFQWLFLLMLNVSHIWPAWTSCWHDSSVFDGFLAVRVVLYICCYMVFFFKVEMVLRDLNLGSKKVFTYSFFKTGSITCLLADGCDPLQGERWCCRRGRVARGMSLSRWEVLGSSTQVEGWLSAESEEEGGFVVKKKMWNNCFESLWVSDQENAGYFSWPTWSLWL